MTPEAQDSAGRARRWPWLLGGVAIAATIGIGACEALGWPFLSGPAQRALSAALDRPVRFSRDTADAGRIRIGLIGGVRVHADDLFIGPPSWSSAPHTLVAQQATLTLAYSDLWRAWRGASLHIASLDADSLDAQIERLADGRSSWQFGPASASTASSAPDAAVPTFGRLRVGAGQARYADAVTESQLDARFSLADASAAPTGAASAPAGLQLDATGTYRKLPVTIDVKTNGVLALTGEGASRVALPITLRARVGRARIAFDGTATDALKLGQLRGRFDVQGSSLAAVGDPLGVTLPTTAAFRTQGLILKEGEVWRAVFDRADIGTSQLGGAFTYDPRGGRPLLSGRLTGQRLLLADLGPAVGAPAPASAASAVPAAVKATATRSGGKVLPDRAFDLPALRAMDANVLVDINDLDLGTRLLQPLRPLRAHLVLTDGVLALNDLDARTAQGRLAGRVQLDGRQPVALWTSDLRWADVRLEEWLRQDRSDNAPPYIAGRLNGSAELAGQGRSTAAILGSLKGRVRMALREGRISHLAVEAAGIDVAQALGLLLKGDDSLPLDCMVAELSADRGVLTPRALLLDTSDSTLWVDGSLSLATEAMDLRVVTKPKDFSPLALRAPIRVTGSLSDPSVSIEKSGLAAKAGAAAALALLNPLAAVLPFLDFGSADEARQAADKCRALAERYAAPGINRPGRPAPAARRTP